MHRTQKKKLTGVLVYP